MKKVICVTLIVSSQFLSGCGTPQYSKPEQSGLRPIAAFPSAGDVCSSLATQGSTENDIAASVDLIGCPSHERGAINDRIDEGFSVSGVQGAWTLLQRETNSQTPSNTSGIDHLTNQTIIFFDKAHGTQVAYLADDGSEWLWYPTNRSALLGYWKTENNNGAPLICFRYPNSSINPVTRVAGPQWECSLLANYDTRIVAKAEGDVFNLSSGKIPFVMNPRQTYRFDKVPQ